MKDEIERIYSTFVTRTHRYPTKMPTDELPLLIGAVDLPVFKHDRKTSPLVRCNGGLHFHAVVVTPSNTRLKEPVTDHFQQRQSIYLGAAGKIQTIHVKPVTETPERVVDYLFKTIARGRISYDDGIVVLPRARQEISRFTGSRHRAAQSSLARSGLSAA